MTVNQAGIDALAASIDVPPTATGFDADMIQVVANMDAAVKNDHAVWHQVNDSLELAGKYQDLELIQMLTKIAFESFEFKAAPSASLARFMAHCIDNGKVAISAKNKTVKITKVDASKPVTFAPAEDWAKFKPPAKTQTPTTLTDAVAKLLKARIDADLDTLDGCAKLNYQAVIALVKADLDKDAKKKADKDAKKANKK